MFTKQFRLPDLHKMERSYDPKLPVEVQLCVLDNLQDDMHAMNACALVCRTWLPTARRAIFAEVELPVHDRLFIDLLASPLATFKTCIRTLSLIGNYTLCSSDASRRLVTALDGISSIRTLKLAHSDLAGLENDILRSICTPFYNIGTLNLDFVKFTSSLTLARFIGHFSGLRHLRVRVFFMELPPQPLDAPCPLFQLESLTYTTQDYDDRCGLMAWFTISDLSRLERLDIGPIPRASLLCLSKFLRASNGGLRRLAIRLFDTVTADDIADCLDFAGVPLLQSLQVFVSLRKSGENRGSSALALLSCIGSRLSQLTLIVSASSPLELNRMDWVALNAALAGWQYRALRDLHVDVACFRDPQTIASTVRDQMGVFAKRGILRVEVKVL